SHIKPERYRIMMHPDLKKFTFAGEETIFLDIKKGTRNIELHAKELKISGVELKTSRGRIHKPRKVVFNKEKETVDFLFSDVLAKGKYQLSLKFNGLLAQKLHGLYRSAYEHKGKVEYLATTQFESIFAREAFPCFDEPSHKAIFDVTLIVPKGLHGISNTMPVAVKEHSAGYEAIKFAPTPKMSTYLLAFIVGKFDYIEGKSKRGVVVRVFATPGKIQQAKFALEVAKKSLDFYENYFAIKYPLPVLDLIAIPDFSAGAMENWGAITYREIALLVDPDNSSLAVKQRVALTIAHEIAHQWFGNLVTMNWWTDLWLNEGFASYAEYMAVDHIFPEWKMWEHFMVGDFATALELDALKNTHAIEVAVKHPREIDEIFDAVSYSKGASIIRMLANYIGPKNFQDGLRIYLKKHAYSNASTADLWKAFEKASGAPVSKIMSAWTKQPGFPFISARREGRFLAIEQRRFFKNARNYKIKGETLWPIPLSISQNNKQNKILFDKKNILLKNTRKGEWGKINVGQTSFTRVLYSESMLAGLSKAVERRKLSSLDRFGLISDAFALSAAGKLRAVDVLELLRAYKNETDVNVSAEVISGLSSIGGLFLDESEYTSYKKYALSILGPIAVKVGWQAKKGDGHNIVLLRPMVLSAAAAYGHKPTISKAMSIFKQAKNGKFIDPNIRSVVYSVAARNGGKNQFLYFLSRYKAEKSQEEKNRLARAMMVFEDKKLFSEFLSLCLSKHVRPQDAFLYLSAAMTVRKNKYVAYDFVKKNWKSIIKRPSGTRQFAGRIIESMQYFADPKVYADMRKFLSKNSMPGIERTIKQTLEGVQSNIDWAKRDLSDIKDWLKGNGF
ncbi:M1 family metallopeptidase, partial [Patescibacteria group bacterium]|nr:M1 family metallopeptidase [Patescibacteria group bacterium]